MSGMDIDLEAIKGRRAERAKATAAARAQQQVTDLAALDALEEEHGSERVARLELDGWREGWPTFVVVKSPNGGSPNYYKRYSDQVRNAKGSHEKIGAAIDELGRACVVYPGDETAKAKLFTEYGGVAVSAGKRAVRFVEATEETEKKD